MIECYGPQHRQAHQIIDELLLVGLRHFYICPGNQNSPLIAALAQREALGDAIVEYHFDERGAAFAALGFAKIIERPAVVVTTSGSAVANVLPAVAEAFRDQVPLVLLTADRPEELTDCGANQTLNQMNLLASQLRWQFAVSAPESQPHSPTDDTLARSQALRTAVDYAAFIATSHPAGPVQLNVAFRKPFFSEKESWEPRTSAVTQYAQAQLVVAESELRRLAQVLRRAKRGMIVVGALSAGADRKAIEDLAQLLQWPVYASVLSGLRRPSFTGLAASHWYLSNDRFAEQVRPDVVLQFGGEPPKPGNALLTFIEQAQAQRILVSAQAERVDPTHSIQHRVLAEPSHFASILAPHLAASPSALTAPLQVAERQAEAVLAQIDEREDITEIAVIRRVFRMLTAEQQLVIANSLPIRIAEFCASRGAPELVANRGLSGIDGLLATAYGAANATKKPTFVLSGDLSFLYDLSSLPLLARSAVPIVVVILNNDGGAIFSQLPFPPLPSRYAELLQAPHGMQCEHLAQAVGVRYAQPQSMAEFGKVFEETIRRGVSGIIEVVTTAADTVAELQQVRELVHQAVRGA